MTRPPREPDVESGFASPTIVDSRRLMGPNLMSAGLGAVLDVALDTMTPDRSARLFTAWHERVAAIADALDWPDAATTQRLYPGGASLFVQAPIDQLMTATDVCEQAWVFAESFVTGALPADPDASLASLRTIAATEADATLRALWDEATGRGLNVTFDDLTLAVGSGAGSQTWSRAKLPHVNEIDWPARHDIPIVLVTGSNGKTTVVRMVAAMARAAGHVVGYTCTDGVWVGDEQVETGDYSGPAGARRVLQDPSVTLAVLETARGGILRRGLAMQHASVAAIVTISPDHFGDYGVTDLATLAEAKLVVAHAVRDAGLLVYNAGVPALVGALSTYTGRTASVAVTANSFDAKAPRRKTAHARKAAETHVTAQELSEDSGPFAPLRPCAFALSSSVALDLTDEEIQEIPATLAGAATHNVLNAGIALTIAHDLQLGPAGFAALKQFGADPRDNVGRLMRYDVGGVTLVVDYAHNPQSVAALIDATRAIPAARRAITLGTGGDRDDDALQAIAKAAVDSQIVDFYIAKEMPRFLRGRAPGSISGVLLAALRALGVQETARAVAPDDIAAVRVALQWAHAGDVILLAIHDQRDAVLALIANLAEIGWHAGDEIPVA